MPAADARFRALVDECGSLIDDLKAQELARVLTSAPGLAVATDDDGTPLVQRAVQNSDSSSPQAIETSLNVVRVVLEAGGRPAQADADGGTALHFAASKLTLEPEFAVAALELLLERVSSEAEVDARDESGESPLGTLVGRIAAVGGNPSPEALRALVEGAYRLVERGASVLGRLTPADEVSPARHEAWTLLHEAAELAPAELLAPLLGARDVDEAMAVADEHGDGPLQIALSRGRRQMAESLLQTFPYATEGPWQGGALPMERRTRDHAIHRLLSGAVRGPSRSSCIPSSTPSSKGGAELVGCIRMMIERHGATIDERDAHGRTPLMVALAEATSLPLAVANELLRHDTAAEACDLDGRCPLMHAAAAAHADAVSTLLSRAAAQPPPRHLLAEPPTGAPSRVVAVDRFGRSALMLAAASRCERAVTLLLEAGADVQAVDADGKCAILLALIGPAEKAGYTGAAAAGAAAAANDPALPSLLAALATPPRSACLSTIRRAEAAEALANELAASKAVQAAGAAATATAALSDDASATAGALAAALMATVSSVHGACAVSVAAALESPEALDAISTALQGAGASLASSGGYPLIAACASGDGRAVSRLVAKDSNMILLHPPSSGSWPSLRALGCRLPIGLLEASAASLPASAALAAASHGHVDVLRALLAHDANSIIRTLPSPTADPPTPAIPPPGQLSHGATPLMAAAAAGSVECVQLLLTHDAGAHASSLSAQLDAASRGALMHAAAIGRSKACVEALLTSGSDVRAADATGRTALEHAAAGGDTGCLDAILQAVGGGSLTRALMESAAGGHEAAIEWLIAAGASVEDALDDALRGGSPSSAEAMAPPMRLVAVDHLAKANGSGMLAWRALRLGAEPALLEGLLERLEATGNLGGEIAYRPGGRGLLHTAVVAVADGKLTDAHVMALMAALPERELLLPDADGVTAIGLASERGLSALSLSLESAALKRLCVTIELVVALVHAPHATRLAERLHGYWPQLSVRIIHHRVTKDSSPRVSPFDVIWIERWGASRRSAVIYTHHAKGDAPLPTERALWRELSRRIDGTMVLEPLSAYAGGLNE